MEWEESHALMREYERLLGEVEALFKQIDRISIRLRRAGYLQRRDPPEPEDPARFDVPDTNELMFAVHEAGGRYRPVSASEVAGVLWEEEHGHGDVVKLGLRLGMMASVGMVDRHRGDGHKPNRWSVSA